MADVENVCEECSQLFRTEWALEGHMKREHGARAATSFWQERQTEIRFFLVVLAIASIIGPIAIGPILRATVLSNSDPDQDRALKLTVVISELDLTELPALLALNRLDNCQTESECSSAVLESNTALRIYESGIQRAKERMKLLDFLHPDGDGIVALWINVMALRLEAVAIWMEGLEKDRADLLDAGDDKWVESATAADFAVLRMLGTFLNE